MIGLKTLKQAKILLFPNCSCLDVNEDKVGSSRAEWTSDTDDDFSNEDDAQMEVVCQ